jgi:hypothetical protein
MDHLSMHPIADYCQGFWQSRKVRQEDRQPCYTLWFAQLACSSLTIPSFAHIFRHVGIVRARRAKTPIVHNARALFAAAGFAEAVLDSIAKRTDNLQVLIACLGVPLPSAALNETFAALAPAFNAFKFEVCL